MEFDLGRTGAAAAVVAVVVVLGSAPAVLGSPGGTSAPALTTQGPNATDTRTETPSPPTPTQTPTVTATPTSTATPTPTATATQTPTAAPPPTATPTPTRSPTSTPPPTPTRTRTPTDEGTPIDWYTTRPPDGTPYPTTSRRPTRRPTPRPPTETPTRTVTPTVPDPTVTVVDPTTGTDGDPIEGDGVTNVRVNRTTVGGNEPFRVVATVENGGSAPETYTVRLSLFGDVVGTERVTVPPGQRRQVVFTLAIAAPGTYEPSVNGLSATVTVTGPDSTSAALDDRGTDREPVPVPGFSGLLALAAVAAFALLTARRRS